MTPLGAVYENWRIRLDSRNEAVDFINESIPKNSYLLVPGELQIDLSQLSSHYQLISVTAQQLIEQGLSPFLPKDTVYILAPRFGADIRFKNKEAAEKLNAVFEPIIKNEIAAFGEIDTLVNYFVPVPKFNPKVSILRCNQDSC